MESDVAPLTVHESVDDSPRWIVVGLAVKFEIVGGVLTSGVVEPLQAKPAARPINTRHMMNHFFIKRLPPRAEFLKPESYNNPMLRVMSSIVWGEEEGGKRGPFLTPRGAPP
jgi:hypothetical protein